MLKFLLFVVLMLSSTFLGYWFALRLSRRSSDLLALTESLEKIKTHISFGSFEIARVICESFQNAENFEVFTDTTGSNDFYMWWKKCVSALSMCTALNKEDKRLLYRFGENLGVTDTEGQLSHCDLYIKLFNVQLKKAREAEEKNTKLYKILGFSLGCTIVLIIM